MNREQISFIKETYQSGTRIRLISMDREPQMTPGLTGEVTMVDDAGQIHVAWENGSSLALICEIDQFIAFSGPTAAEYLRDKYPPNESIWFREELPGCRRAVTIDLDRLIKETDDYAERVVSNTMDLAVATRNLYNTMMIFDAFLSDYVLSDDGIQQINQSSEFTAEESETAICPKCGNDDLKYGTMELVDTFVVYPWECKACGSEGKEFGAIVFDGHEVTDSPYFEC